jgi:ankyrin repeat protein
MKNAYGDTPLHLAVENSNSVEIVRELAQLQPTALETKDVYGDTPLHLAVGYSDSVEMIRELVSLSPAALVTENDESKTPLAIITTSFGNVFEMQGKLQVLLEAAPQAAGIACSTDHNSLPLHQILEQSSPTVTSEMVAMVLAAYRDAVNIPDDNGWLPVHIAAQFESTEILQMIAEENMSNLLVITPSHGSMARLIICDTYMP